MGVVELEVVGLVVRVMDEDYLMKVEVVDEDCLMKGTVAKEDCLPNDPARFDVYHRQGLDRS